MDQGLIPRRYAKALLSFAREKQCEGQLYELMLQLESAFAANQRFQSVLANPHVETADKLGLIRTAVGEDLESDVFADFLKLLVVNKRLGVLRGIALAYIALYRTAHRIYSVSVTSAAPLAQAELDRIHTLVDKHLPDGATAEISQAVDPALIGGFTVAIDNERLDASVANELKQLRLKLLSN
ncbi:MAG: ATP synthase F1 subunit delta [Muribaculaceae bacterium]|nr:ATP synthase F1 subunit delta [Muribaculaceae bacterium]